MKAAITSYVFPILLYAIEVWYPPLDKDKKSLERVNKFVARLLTNNFDRTTDYQDLLTKSGMKPLYRIVCERRLIYVKKCMDRSTNDDIFQLVPPLFSRSSQRIAQKINRHTLQLKIENNSRNQREGNLPASQMKILWNYLSEEIIRLSLPKYILQIAEDNLFRQLSIEFHLTVDVCGFLTS
jgi:hypothetical protein